jgi:AcrR family transcriptional regulator
MADRPAQRSVVREQLPSGRARHGLSAEEVAAMQRARLLDGLIEAVARKGYAALTVGDISAAARVSRRTFYEHFRDKEDCFMAAIDVGTTEMLEEMARAFANTDELFAALDASVLAYLASLDRRPDFARAFHLEILAAGPRGLEFRADVHRRFAEMYRELYAHARRQDPALPDVPELTFRLATGSFDEFLLEWVRAGRIGQLKKLAPVATFVARTMLGAAATHADELDGVSARLTVDTLPS